MEDMKEVLGGQCEFHHSIGGKQSCFSDALTIRDHFDSVGLERRAARSFKKLPLENIGSE